MKSYMTNHGYTADLKIYEETDEATALPTSVLKIPIREDAAETNRYGGTAVMNWTP